MRLKFHNIFAAQPRVVELAPDFIRIGRKNSNDVVLESPYVPDEAVWIRRQGDNWLLQCVGGKSCRVDSQLLELGNSTRLDNGTTFLIHPYSFCIEDLEPAYGSRGGSVASAWECTANELVNQLHIQLLDEAHLSAEKLQADELAVLRLEQDIDKLCSRQRALENRELLTYLAGQYLRSRILLKLFSDHARDSIWELPKQSQWQACVTAIPELDQYAMQVLDQIESKMELSSVVDISEKVQKVDAGFWAVWCESTESQLEQLIRYLAYQELKKQLKDMIFGYGPLEDLLRNPCIDEIMVINSHKIYVEKCGVVEDSGRHFVSDNVTLGIIERIVSLVDRQIDKSQPMVDARLRDGSRVNAVIPPITLTGPCLTIRKFPQRRLTIRELVRDKKTLSRAAAEFLRVAVRSRSNILISGGTGTGKTTLLNCLSQFIPNKERIVAIEDTAELQLAKDHVVRMESKLANSEGKGAFKIRDLVRNALRMRPDRIVVGECRGPEALDMLQAMNTGHDGSMTTLHANGAADALLRLEVLVLDAANLPVQAIRQQIASAVDFIIQLERLPNGLRAVKQIVEVCGFDNRSGQVKLKPIFQLEPHHDSSVLQPTGYLPTCIEEMISAGLNLSYLYPAI